MHCAVYTSKEIPQRQLICLQVTGGVHTGQLESVHSLYTKYVPKRKKFNPQGLSACLHLAAMDHNFAVDHWLVNTKHGQLRYKLQYSKSSANYVMKPITTAKQHQYRHELLLGITDRCKHGETIILGNYTCPYMN